MCVCVLALECMYMYFVHSDKYTYLPIPPLGQDMTQGQFF